MKGPNKKESCLKVVETVKQKRQKQTEEDQVKEQKGKEREEKKKKKDEDQQRQKYLLEARKAQAASRWAASDTQTEEEVMIFTPEPVRQTNISSSCQSLIETTPPAQQSLDSTNSQVTNTERNSQTSRMKKTSPATSSQSSKQPTTPAQLTLPSTHRNQTANIRDASQTIGKTPARPSNTKRTSEARRGLHFQSAAAESSDDEISEGGEDNPEQSGIISDSSSHCCKEKRLEIEALRKRLEKLHKRLNISCKFPCIYMYTILQLFHTCEPCDSFFTLYHSVHVHCRSPKGMWLKEIYSTSMPPYTQAWAVLLVFILGSF